MKAIVAQQLIPTIDGTGRAAAIEVLINTPIIQSCIKKGQVDLLKDYMAKGQSAGMQTFDQAIYDLYERKIISYADALQYSDSESELRLKVKLSEGNNRDTGSLEGIGLQE